GNTGSVIRLHDEVLTRFRQMTWLVYPQTNTTSRSLFVKGFGLSGDAGVDLTGFQTETLACSFTNSELIEIELVSDNFSSFYCFFFVIDDIGNQSIRWVCDGLLLKESATGEYVRDRLTHPYDIDYIPLVWTPTPTPTGSLATPLPTWTPRPDGMWVADMAGHRIVRLNDRGIIQAQTYTEDISAGNYEWSEYENFSVISPNDVSAAYDGSCWAIDWGRNKVVKIAADGSVVAETVPCPVIDPDICFEQELMIHPLAIDCAGDPNSCFVADYEGNHVYKLTVAGDNITAVASNVQYYRPKAIEVSREIRNEELKEMVWVADRWSNEPTPAHNWTFTPIPTRTPTPGPGTPVATPCAPTPYPELQRVSRNEFGQIDLIPIECAIPLSMSVKTNEANDTHCWIADRDAGYSVSGRNYVRWLIISGGEVEQRYIGKDDGYKITRPVDVDIVGIPPTSTPTPTP
ncbi:hypothetical protein K8T06_07195, partial [bacterium]|nr:hypothetical protein [bacterium]